MDQRVIDRESILRGYDSFAHYARNQLRDFRVEPTFLYVFILDDLVYYLYSSRKLGTQQCLFETLVNFQYYFGNLMISWNMSMFELGLSLTTIFGRFKDVDVLQFWYTLSFIFCQSKSSILSYLELGFMCKKDIHWKNPEFKHCWQGSRR